MFTFGQNSVRFCGLLPFILPWFDAKGSHKIICLKKKATVYLPKINHPFCL